MNNINITNTTVNVTKVTNVYNTVILNRSATINNITYVNQRVTGGVTVVSHDAFVNARPVAANIMRVDANEIARAPVTHGVAAEPVRTSVLGAGRPVTARPPAAVISRPVVAVRTPPPLPKPIEQRQAQAGGHLNQQLLVRPMAPARPAPVNQAGRAEPNQEGFRPFGQSNANAGTANVNNNTLVKPTLRPQPRVYEQQGQSEESGSTPTPENRNLQQQENPNSRPANREFRPPQQGDRPAPPQETHPLVRPAPPVQQRTAEQEQQQEQKFNQWHEQRPSSPPPQPRAQPEPRPSPPPKQEPSKKNH